MSSIYKLENASLVLKSSDLTLNGTNGVGTCDQYRITMTWNNINLRTVLGDMYDKYDTFNLYLNFIGSATSNANLGNSNDDRQIIVNMKGLPWINQTYSVANISNTDTKVLGIFEFVTDQSQVLNFTDTVTTFGKSQEQCNITIYYSKILDSTTPSTTEAFPNVIFIFGIFGVGEPKKDITNQRI